MRFSMNLLRRSQGVLTASVGFNKTMQAINNAMMPLANMTISRVIERWFGSGLFEGTIGISLQ